MNFEQRYAELYTEMYELCQKNGAGDPFSYARSREILMANVLGHKVGATYRGCDGYDDNGEYEYKSTIDKNIKGTYNGISVMPTLDEQVDYIKNKKIGKYPFHYFARFEGSKIVEVWRMSGEKVAELLLPKIVKQYEHHQKVKVVDPRIGVHLTKKEIYKYGERIL